MVLARAARLASRWIGREEDVQLAALGVLTWAGIQWYGRTLATNEWDDLGAMALVGLILWLALGREPHRFPGMSERAGTLVRRAGTNLQARLKAAWPRIGVDLVEDPPFARGLPRLFWAPGVALAAFGLLFIARPWNDGLELVALARTWAYPVYLLAVGLFWTLAVVVGIFGLLLPFALIWNWACATYRGHDERRKAESRRAMTWTFAAMALTVLVFPAPWAIGAVGWLALATVALLHHPKQPNLSVIWRPRHRAERHRSTEWRTLQSLETMVIAGGCTVLMTVPALGALGESQRELAPVTALLRWLVCLGGLWLTLALAAYRLHFSLNVSLNAPSTRNPRRIRIRGGSHAERERATERFRRDGWKVLDAEDPRLRVDDMRVTLDSGAELESPHFADLSKPIAPELLENDEVLWRLKRRADLRSRRSVMKGLKAIFKEAAAGLRGPGTGFIVAPHQWFMLGLARDIADHDTTEDRSVEGFLQPEYRAVMTPRARHHLYLVLQSAGVDLIYVEDGVGYRRLALALRVIFELFDRHGVDRRVSSRDFSTVHGVHAIVHDVTPDNPRVSETYPEPDYESETRARILHLYRDRGGEEGRVDVPVETDGIPLLV
ncbi:hypothetical protein Poly30_34250 [Planctomycetes bacterium Poly30]|uniref:Uncharacterized protein n=1 Tax=Saltatorellus ferox TaxID=2528018 RepID=A0A518EUX0_9BACT|nr:hypothetical protein Poly30_34250 [Planctomycetes bacterium Poly30]